MKKIILLLLVIVFLVSARVVLAQPDNQYGRAATPPFPQPAEKDLKKVIFIRYAPGKEPTCNNNDVCDKGENWKKCPDECEKPGNGEEPTPSPEPSACYDFLSGAMPKWNWTEDFYFESGLGNVSRWATETWEAATSGDIFKDSVSGEYPWGEYDYHNSITYDDYSNPNVIAVAAIWFRGKNIYEYDIMFDIDYFPNKDIDLNTVALHEFGHAAGLDDLYDAECLEEVMYGYYEGEKTTLGEGDKIGIQALYGI